MSKAEINGEIINKPKTGKRRLRKVVKWIVISIFLLIFFSLAAMPPLMMKDMVDRRVDFKKVFTAEEFGLSSNKLSLQTSDGLNIVAYEVYAPNPKAVVIFLSGIHNPSVTAFYGHSKLLLEKGYASILVEMRAHGESEGDVICVGFKEYLDTEAAVEYIKNDTRYKDVPIVVFGLSMGGATAINSIGEIPEIDGLISLSAYSSWEDAFHDNMLLMDSPKFLAAIQKPFVKLYTTFKYGFESFNISPKKEIKKLGNRPALLMHSKDDSQVPFASFERIMANAPKHVETWVREGDLHLILKDASFLEPEKDKEYTETILSFLDKHFGQ
ncbi:MAG: alpha/beta hydrolase [Bacillota bacterium]